MARLAPLTEPFPADARTVLEKMAFGMPTPLALFRTIAHNPRVLDRIRMGGLLDKGSLSLRQRELMIRAPDGNLIVFGQAIGRAGG